MALCVLSEIGNVSFSLACIGRKEGRTIRKCIEVTSACDYNENILDFGMVISTELFLMEIEGNMIGLLKVLL